MVGIWVEIGNQDNGTTLSHHLGLVKLAIRLALPFTGIYPRSKLIPFRAQSPEKVLESLCQAQITPVLLERPAPPASDHQCRRGFPDCAHPTWVVFLVELNVAGDPDGVRTGRKWTFIVSPENGDERNRRYSNIYVPNYVNVP